MGWDLLLDPSLPVFGRFPAAGRCLIAKRLCLSVCLSASLAGSCYRWPPGLLSLWPVGGNAVQWTRPVDFVISPSKDFFFFNEVEAGEYGNGGTAVDQCNDAYRFPSPQSRKPLSR